MDRIRHIATSRNGSRAAVAAFEVRVAVWNLTTGKKISEFDTVLDFGGKRLAIATNGRHVAAGAYHRHGIACYQSNNGSLVWQRNDLKKVQYVTISVDDRFVICGFADKPLHVLALSTGKTISTMAGVKEMWASSHENLIYVFRGPNRAELRRMGAAKPMQIPLDSFAVLDVAFAPGLVCVSECGGPIRCFSTKDGQEIWHHVHKGNSHAICISTDRRGSSLFFVQMWVNDPDKRHIGCLRMSDGKLTLHETIPSSAVYGFFRGGRRLLTWNGSIIDTGTANPIQKLNFPDTRNTE